MLHSLRLYSGQALSPWEGTGRREPMKKDLLPWSYHETLPVQLDKQLCFNSSQCHCNFSINKVSRHPSPGKQHKLPAHFYAASRHTYYSLLDSCPLCSHCTYLGDRQEWHSPLLGTKTVSFSACTSCLLPSEGGSATRFSLA